MTLHITQIEGGSALSSFRVQQLLPGLQAIHDKINGIAARFVHLVTSDTSPSPALADQLAALLTYGDPYGGSTEGPLVVVSPPATLTFRAAVVPAMVPSYSPAVSRRRPFVA